jgi:hypothetical protein
MANDRETQLHPAREGGEKGLDNNGRNAVRPQTQEPYGDEPLAVETKVTHERHYAGQPLETVVDREANDQVRAERYERARVDRDFARAQKIDVEDDDVRDDAFSSLEDPFTPNPGPPVDEDEAKRRQRDTKRLSDAIVRQQKELEQDSGATDEK